MPVSPRELRDRLNSCLLRDRRRLRGLIDRFQATKNESEASRIAELVERSARAARSRAERLPAHIAFPEQLPVSGRRDEIGALIRERQVVIVCGETGSGKTTQLPKICLEAGRGIYGAIGHTQPRRIAARSVATRIAEELDVTLGTSVGFKVRFGDHTSPTTLVKLMTDGILLAETQNDPLLESYDTIIVDEAHERSLNIDFLLGYLRQLLPRRPDLRVIVTSATIDPQRFATHFADSRGPAPIVEVSGRTYPVEVRYQPRQDDDLTDAEAIAGAVEELLAVDPAGRGDVLVFLAGEREIRETAEELRIRPQVRADILPLYARLSAAEQMRVFDKHAQRRVVLATNVAETSLTVPGIRYVVDPGFARISRYAPRTKVQRLPVEPVSRASADQRAGRCGRVEAGICIRLYDEEDYSRRDRFTDPEILRTNLASVILQMKSLRLGPVEQFPFLEPPEARSIKDGYETLHELGAIDEKQALTPIGRSLARLPVDPRIGRMIIAAGKEHCLAEVLTIAAALSIQDPRERPMEKQEAADQAHAEFRDPAGDFATLLKLWQFYHDQGRKLGSSRLRKLCREKFLSPVRMREWADVRHQLLELSGELGLPINHKPAKIETVHRAVLTGLLSNVGQKSPEGPEYRGTRSVKFNIFPGSVLFKAAPKWVVAAELVQTTKLYARTLAPINPEWLEELGAHLLTRSHFDPHWSAEAQQVFTNERVHLLGLEVVGRRRVKLAPIDPVLARQMFIHHALVEGELRTEGPFLVHNRASVEEVRALEQKGRRSDLLADTQARFAFYDARVPQGLSDGASFEKWRREVERKDSRILYFRQEDLLVGDASGVTAEQYPDKLTGDGLNLPLSYVCEPGTARDGITVTVPVESLGQIDGPTADRLVPGMLKEKVTALIKTLPRGVRKYFGPDAVEACIVAAVKSEEPLAHTVATVLAGFRSVEVTPSMLKPEELPEHLRMNFRVVDMSGREIASGRDLEGLRTRLADQIRTSLKTGAAKNSPFVRERVTEWDFGDLPEHVVINRGTMSVRAYPGLADEGGNVALRLYDTLEACRAGHSLGVRRLAMLGAKDELRYHVRLLSGLQRMALHHATIGPPELLHDDLSSLVAQRAFLSDAAPIRTKAAFDGALARGWKRINEAASEADRLATAILAAYHGVVLRLDGTNMPGAAHATADVRQQIKLLVPPRFLSTTPAEWLPHLARFLGGAELRLRKLAGGGIPRDLKNAELIAPHWSRVREALAKQDATMLSNPSFVLYRWMVEELRISLFAQELHTSVSVSPKRLDQQWSTVTAAR